MLGSALFLLTLFVLKRDLKRLNRPTVSNLDSIINPLVDNEESGNENEAPQNRTFDNEAYSSSEEAPKKIN